MRSLPFFLLPLLLACTPQSVAPPAEDGPIEDSAPADTSAPEDTADTGECDGEGEACVDYEDGLSSCCNGRHTCFPKGCYYSQP